MRKKMKFVTYNKKEKVYRLLRGDGPDTSCGRLHVCKCGAYFDFLHCASVEQAERILAILSKDKAKVNTPTVAKLMGLAFIPNNEGKVQGESAAAVVVE